MKKYNYYLILLKVETILLARHAITAVFLIFKMISNKKQAPTLPSLYLPEVCSTPCEHNLPNHGHQNHWCGAVTE